MNTCESILILIKVTGGAHGIGRCIALELAAEGCKVAIVDIDGVGAQKTSDELKSMKVESVAYSVNKIVNLL